jgi:serine/threonine protein kinase
LAVANVAEALATKRWELDDKLIAFRAMCRSIQRVHSGGVAHRDVKLSNFLIGANGAVKLSDFGTAKLFKEGPDPLLPKYAFPVGDIGFAGPEIFAALHDVDPTIYFRSDLYALGSTFFELLTGLHLAPLIFDAATLHDLSRAMNSVPREHRKRVYDGFIASLASSRPLPTLRYCGLDLPTGVGEIIERLYMEMCALDYRQRLVDFPTIFSRLNQATIILRNHAAFIKWRRRREIFKRNVELKAARRNAWGGRAGRTETMSVEVVIQEYPVPSMNLQPR